MNIKQWNVFFLSLWMSLGTLISRFFGLFRDIAFAHFLSPSLLDEFVVAFKLPNVVRGFLGEGQFATVFLPFYIEKKNIESAKKFSSVVFSFLLLTSMLIVFFGAFFMEEILKLLLQQSFFELGSQKLFYLVWLSRWLLCYTIFVVLFSYLSALIQEKGRFFLAALAPACLNASFIVFVFLSQWGEEQRLYLIFGTLVGGLLQVLLLIPPLIKEGLIPKFTLFWNHSGLFVLLKSLVPGLITVLFFHLISLFNIYFASNLESGSLSFLYLSERLFQLPFSLFSISLGTALLPKLSHLVSLKQNKEAAQCLHEQLGILLFLLLPSAVGLFLLAQPLVELFFQRGEFSDENVKTISGILQISTASLVFVGLNKMLSTSFFSHKKMKWSAVNAGIGFLFYLVSSYFFIELYGIFGLAWAMAVGAVFNTLSGIITHSFVVSTLDFKALLKKIILFILPLGGLILGVLTVRYFINNIFLKVLLSVTLGSVIYFYLSLQLKLFEAFEVLNSLKRMCSKK